MDATPVRGGAYNKFLIKRRTQEKFLGSLFEDDEETIARLSQQL
jgi:hypothetical protein